MFAAQGGNVIIADLSSQAGEALASKLGERACYVTCDVSREDHAKAAVGDAIKNFGGVHGLVNCAGIAIGEKTVGRDGPHQLESFTRVININLIGTFNMIRVAADAMSKQQANSEGERGVIINTASVAAFDGQIGQAAYSASKSGVVGMTLPIARDLSRNGIRVVTIAPGIFETAMLKGMPADVQQSLGKQVPFPPASDDRPNMHNSCNRSSRISCSTVKRSGSTGRFACRPNKLVACSNGTKLIVS